MIQWIKKLITAFGASFLWLVCLVYYIQGFRSFVWTAVSYQLKDVLKLSPSTSQFISSVAFVPWSIKPVYGILSDCLPIKGRKRTPYLIIATVLSLVPWPILGLNLTVMSSKHLVVLLTLQNLGSAMADVVIDAMVAEAARFERAVFASDLQSLSWFSLAFGGICGNLLGGYALTSLEIGTIFTLFALLPALQLLSCGLVHESTVDQDLVSSSSSHLTNGHDGPLEDTVLSTGDSKPSSYRRKKRRKNSKKKSAKSPFPKLGDPYDLSWYSSIKAATFSLVRTFRQRAIWRPMAWFFLAHVMVPDLSTVMFYYQTEFLSLDASFLGTMRVIGWFGLMCGTFIYNRYLKPRRLRIILFWAHLGLSLLSALNMILISRLNLAYGISDKIMVLGGSALGEAISQFKFLPFLILSGQLCPVGIEGTLFALFMSINNLGRTLGSFVGASLASFLNLSSGSFTNLLPGFAVQAICNLIPITLLFLIPFDSSGVSV